MGVTTVTANFGGETRSTTVTVVAASVISVQVNPPVTSVAIHGTTSLTATAKLDDGSTRDVTFEAQWTSSSPAAASVSQGREWNGWTWIGSFGVRL